MSKKTYGNAARIGSDQQGELQQGPLVLSHRDKKIIGIFICISNISGILTNKFTSHKKEIKCDKQDSR
jgi:hypothetical protein